VLQQQIDDLALAAPQRTELVIEKVKRTTLQARMRKLGIKRPSF
jgi:hypothetical protein